MTSMAFFARIPLLPAQSWAAAQQLWQGWLNTARIKWFAVWVGVCPRRGKRGHGGIAKKGNVKQRTQVKDI